MTRLLFETCARLKIFLWNLYSIQIESKSTLYKATLNVSSMDFQKGKVLLLSHIMKYCRLTRFSAPINARDGKIRDMKSSNFCHQMNKRSLNNGRLGSAHLFNSGVLLLKGENLAPPTKIALISGLAGLRSAYCILYGTVRKYMKVNFMGRTGFRQRMTLQVGGSALT